MFLYVVLPKSTTKTDKDSSLTGKKKNPNELKMSAITTLDTGKDVPYCKITQTDTPPKLQSLLCSFDLLWLLWNIFLSFLSLNKYSVLHFFLFSSC